MLANIIQKVTDACLDGHKSVNEGDESAFLSLEIERFLPYDFNLLAKIVAEDPHCLTFAPGANFIPNDKTVASYMQTAIYQYVYDRVKEELKGKIDTSML